jgi:hypothetical protein
MRQTSPQTIAKIKELKRSPSEQQDNRQGDGFSLQLYDKLREWWKAILCA